MRRFNKKFQVNRRYEYKHIFGLFNNEKILRFTVIDIIKNLKIKIRYEDGQENYFYVDSPMYDKSVDMMENAGYAHSCSNLSQKSSE